MSSSGKPSDIAADWEVTPEGLYIATRHFLLRRGYCCSNRCLNCPYVNWRDRVNWERAPAEAIRRTTVLARTLAGVRAALAWHEQALLDSEDAERSYHEEMIEHYRLLLARWR